MNRSTQLEYYRLEGFKEQREQQPPSVSKAGAALLKAWRTLCETAIKALTDSGEPVIHKRRDRHGNDFYAVYDPKSDQHFTCSSEEELRWWIEQRYRA